MAAGTRLGTGYVSVQPDFSGFQERVAKRLNETLGPAMDRAGTNASKRLSKSLGNNSSLRSSLQPLLKRFQKFGDSAGEEIASHIGKGSKRASGDMFGLSGAIKEMEKRSSSASSRAKIFANDTFGIARAARDAGQSYKLLRNATRDWSHDAKTADSVGKRLSKGITSLFGDLRDVGHSLKVASGGFGNFEGIMARANRGFQFFRNILGSLKIPTLLAGVALLAQSLSALAAGAVATAAALAPLSGALIALPAAALAGAQAVGVLKLALSGIGAAVKAGLTAQIQGGEQATQTLRTQENAAEALADAHRTLSSSERDAKYAQEDLTKARKEATRQLEDMRIASEESSLTEREGALALREARRELNKTLRDPGATGLDVQRAEQAVEQAKFSLEETRVDAKRARADYTEAQKKGVEGMPEVVSAKRALADANRSVSDAERGVAKAVRENTDAMKQQGSAATALDQKMAELTPSGRKFARFLISLKPQFDSLRETAARGLFPGAEKGIHSLLGNLGVVKRIVAGTSSALGALATKAGAKLGSKAWGRDLGKVGAMNTRILTRMGDAGLNVADAFRNILVSAEPLLEWMSKGTVKLSEWLKAEAQAGRETGSLGHFFDETREAMEKVWHILKPVGEGLLNIGHAAKPLGNEILDSLGKAAQGWADWTKSTEGQNKLKRYFVEVKPAIFAIGRLVRDATGDFAELGRQKGVATLVESIRKTLLPLLTKGSGVITGFVSNFLNKFNDLRKEGTPAFDAFVQTLAEHAGEAGVKLAGALTRGFINSDIWGKLAIGGFLFSKFGGIGTFGKLGKTAGTRFASAFLLAVLSVELAKQIKEIIEGHELQAPQTEKVAAKLRGAFALSLDDVKIPAPDRVRISTELGSLIFDARTERVIAAKGKKLQQFVGQIPETLLPKFDKLREIKGKFDAAMQPLPGKAQKTVSGINKSFLSGLDDLIHQGGEKSKAFASQVSGLFGDLNTNIGSALKSIIENTRQALEKLGVKGALKQFTIKHPNFVYGTSASPNLARQQGGPVPKRATGGLASVVPGHGTGDRHTLSLNGRPIAKVESREGIFVGNRKMMAAAKQANDAVPRFQDGGFVGSGQQLKRGGLVEPKLEGNGGPLMQLGKAAIHKVFKGAQDYLAKHQPMAGALGGITGSGPVESVFAKVAKKLSRSKIATLALGEAGFAESGMRDLGYGDGTSEGALQLLASTAAGIGIDPHDEGAVASAFLLRGFTGKGGANKLAAQGLPAQLVAQGVQGSAFSDGSNYLAQEGAAKGWMRRFGLQSGGLLKGLVRGGPIGTAIQRLAAGGMVDPSWDPGNETIASSIAQLVGEYAKRYDADITAGFDPGGGHVSPGHNVTGTATDVVPRDGNWDGAFAKGLEELASLGFEVGYDGSIPGTQSWPDHGRGNHAHIEWVGNGTAGNARQRLREYLGGVDSSAVDPGAAQKEEIPTKYRRFIQPINFPPMPKHLEGITKEIAGWQSEIGTYRSAKRYAEGHGKPGMEQAVGRNLSAIEQRLAALAQLRTRLRLQGVKKSLKKRLGGALKKMAGYDQLIEGSQREYESAAQYAEQVVDLEPQSPELPANATDAQREAAEKDYVKRYTAYVDGDERDAFGTVLEKVADWRNKILRAELFGFGDKQPPVARMETGWEVEDRHVTDKITQIKDFAKAVGERLATFKKDHPKAALPNWLQKQVNERAAQLKELPILQLKDTQLRKAIGNAREAFFPGGENRLKPNVAGIPALPLPGSGTLEESLKDVQGIHWPDLHELLPASALAPPRVAGKFGGVIWDVQTSIEELGLKISQAVNGLGSGGGGEDGGDTERSSLLEQLLREANQRNILRGIEERVFAGMPKVGSGFQLGGLVGVTPAFGGTFHGGGIVPGPPRQERMVKVAGREGIFTEEQMAAMGGSDGGSIGDIKVHVHGDIVSSHPDPVEVLINDRRFPAEVRKVTDHDGRRETRGAGRRLARAGVFGG